ncbi:hypothetical protein OKW41_000286 [Paraburkholderia sp. UCT70]|uniref:hypothetical protein n=1 Tax=Paraburkholderia sp. UCT70 TaxID=2991068 RepID=UPI003D1EDDE1
MIARSVMVAFLFAVLDGCGGGSVGGAENGPGVVLTQVVNPATGATLVVNAPNNPLNGTAVTIPPNVLGTTQGSVAIRKSALNNGPHD